MYLVLLFSHKLLLILLIKINISNTHKQIQDFQFRTHTHACLYVFTILIELLTVPPASTPLSVETIKHGCMTGLFCHCR